MNFTAKSSKSQSGKIENRAKYKEKESVDRLDQMMTEAVLILRKNGISFPGSKILPRGNEICATQNPAFSQFVCVVIDNEVPA